MAKKPFPEMRNSHRAAALERERAMRILKRNEQKQKEPPCVRIVVLPIDPLAADRRAA
jgi:hypothetical protein